MQITVPPEFVQFCLSLSHFLITHRLSKNPIVLRTKITLREHISSIFTNKDAPNVPTQLNCVTAASSSCRVPSAPTKFNYKLHVRTTINIKLAIHAWNAHNIRPGNKFITRTNCFLTVVIMTLPRPTSGERKLIIHSKL